MGRHLVRNARVFKQGDGAAERVPDGTHVYLDYPGGPIRFRHFVVQGGRLRLADHPDHQVVNEASYAHFCVWGPEELPVTLHPQSAAYEPIEGFGYPLPARFLGNRLILPDTRTLHLRVVDVSGSSHADAVIDRQVEQAHTYLEKLHINLVHHVEQPDLPAGMILDQVSGQRFDDTRLATQLSRDSEFTRAAGSSDVGAIRDAINTIRFVPSFHRLVYDVPQLAPVNMEIRGDWNRLEREVMARMRSYRTTGHVANDRELPSFQRGFWAPPSSERATSIVAIYVKVMRGMGATAGVAWPYYTVFRSVLNNGQLWDHTPCPYLFLAAEARGAARNVIQPLTHEIGHCLLAEGGASHIRLETFEDEYESMTKTKQLFAGWGVETTRNPGEVLYRRHIQARGRPARSSHHVDTDPRNLMQAGGGNALTPFQVAAIRANPTIGDGPTPQQAARARQAPELSEETGDR